MKRDIVGELAEQYCEKRYGFNNHEFDAFVAGYKAARDVVEEELKLARIRRKDLVYEELLHEHIINGLLEKMGEV